MGREAAAEMVRSLFVAFPDLHFPKEEIEIYRSLDGRKAAARWHMVATMSGRLDPPGFEPTGRTVELTGMCAYVFRGGLIAHHSMFYDVMSFSQQIGLMPAMDSAPVKALVGVQNLSQKIVRMVKR
jgi:predicted ester cyclase